MIATILALWLAISIPVGVLFGRFLKAAEPQEHARIKNASGGSANGDSSSIHSGLIKTIRERNNG